MVCADGLVSSIIAWTLPKSSRAEEPVMETVGGRSSSSINTLAEKLFALEVAFVSLPRPTEKDSSDSLILSSRIVIDIVFSVWPGANVSWPLVGIKSVIADPLPEAEAE